MNESENRKLFQKQDRGVCPSPNWDSLKHTTYCAYFNKSDCLHRDCKLYEHEKTPKI